MNHSSDEFDADIRQPLYDLLDVLNNSYADTGDSALDLIHHHLLEAVGMADDYRMDLMDLEEAEEEEE